VHQVLARTRSEKSRCDGARYSRRQYGKSRQEFLERAGQENQPLVQYSLETLPVVMAHLDYAKLEHARLVAAKVSPKEASREK
jgi:hypothetical protein